MDLADQPAFAELGQTAVDWRVGPGPGQLLDGPLPEERQMRQQSKRPSVTLGQAFGGRHGVSPVDPSVHVAASVGSPAGSSIGSGTWRTAGSSAASTLRLPSTDVALGVARRPCLSSRCWFRC